MITENIVETSVYHAKLNTYYFLGFAVNLSQQSFQVLQVARFICHSG